MQNKPWKETAIYSTKNPLVGHDIEPIKEINSKTARRLNIKIIKELFIKLKDERDRR